MVSSGTSLLNSLTGWLQPGGAAARRRRRRLMVSAKRAGLLGLGSGFMLAGVASAPTPLPIGFVLFALGLYFAARGSKKARRSVKWLRRRSPSMSRGLNRIKDRMPANLRLFIERSDPGV